MSDTPAARPWPCRTRRLTPDEVLAHLRAFCVEMIGLAESEVEKKVVPAATLRVLVGLATDFDWVDFPSYFGLEADDNWAEGWKPDSTVGDLCNHLARRIALPVWEPVTMLGRECESAGAFLAIRNMLAAEGVDVGKLGPSSPVAPYLRRHPAVFGRVRLASGGRLPHVETPTRGFVVAYAVLLVATVLTGLFTGVLGGCGVAWPTSLPFALIATLAVILGFVAYARHRAARYPADFRQLVFTLLGRTPRIA